MYLNLSFHRRERFERANKNQEHTLSNSSQSGGLYKRSSIRKPWSFWGNIIDIDGIAIDLLAND